MTDSEIMIANRIVTFGAFGGLVFMALVGWLLAFDVASMSSLIADAVNRDILTALIVGGAITKGVAVGGAIGIGSLTLGASQPRMTHA